MHGVGMESTKPEAVVLKDVTIIPIVVPHLRHVLTLKIGRKRGEHSSLLILWLVEVNPDAAAN